MYIGNHDIPVNNMLSDRLSMDAQVDINIYVGEHNSVALMAMNAYRISKYTGVDFVWYEDAYMKKEVNKGCTEENEMLNKLKNNILSRVCRKALELFWAPELYFGEEPLGFRDTVITEY